MKTLIIVDIPANIKPINSEVISRHEVYAKSWSEATGNLSRILVISLINSKKEIKRHSFGNLDLVQIPVRLNLKNLRELRALRKELLTHEVSYISADPWVKFIATKIFSKFFRLPGNIQVQLHGDFFDSDWFMLNWRNALKRFILPASLLLAYNIRVVSTETQNRLMRSSLYRNKRIYRIPVPLNLNFNNVEFYSKNRPWSVGILGRLHHERGLDNFLAYLNSYPHDLEGINFIVAGEGPEKDKFKEGLEELVGSQSVEFLGELSQPELEKFWGRIGVLASFASSESYGRSIRESLCHGVPVLAHPSRGARLLHSEMPGCALEIVQPIERRINLQDQIRKLIVQETSREFLEISRNENARILGQLTKSWEALFK